MSGHQNNLSMDIEEFIRTLPNRPQATAVGRLRLLLLDHLGLRTVLQIVSEEVDWKNAGPEGYAGARVFEALDNGLRALGLHRNMAAEEIAAYGHSEETTPSAPSAPEPPAAPVTPPSTPVLTADGEIQQAFAVLLRATGRIGATLTEADLHRKDFFRGLVVALKAYLASKARDGLFEHQTKPLYDALYAGLGAGSDLVPAQNLGELILALTKNP